MGTSKKDKSDRERDKEERTSRSGKRRNRSRERDRSRERSRHKAGHSRSRSRSRERGGKERGKGRDRSRDRSRSRERDSSRKSSGKEREKESSRKRDGHRRRRHSSSSSVEGEKRENSDKKRERDKDRERDRPHGSGEKEEEVGGEEVTVVPSSSGDATSLSIEETNKLRAKLGLKPLDVGDSKASSSSKDSGKVDGETNGEGQTTDEASAAKKKEDVHVPAKNIGDIKSAEKLKEKMAVMREKRRVAKLLSGVKTLGSAGDGGEDSAASWVIKMKQREEEKKKAAKKAQMLAEMDEEFGVGELVRESIKEERNKAYTSSDLSGLKVEHSTDAFREGKDIVLTLKDKGVLDEDDDVLMNVNIVDDEKAVKNVELKKGKSDYNPYEEEEVDEFGNLKRVSILKKYDEEIEGAKKSSFALGTQGEVDTSEDRQREIVRQRLKEKEISLELAPAQVASEYYTAEEMVQFKRPKKKRKIRKKEKVKADDLLSLESSQESSSRGASKDHGSRRSRGGDRKERGKADDEDAVMEVDIDPNTASDLKDEDDPNMDLALTRTRRLLQRSKPGVQGTAKVLSMLQSVPKVKEEPGVELGAESGEPGGEAIVLDTIAEFCRQVGEREGESRGGLYNEDEEEGEGEGEMEEEEQERRDDVMEVDQLIQEELGGWMEVKPHTQKKVEPKEEDLYQEAEPMVRSGIAAALQLASKKGFISGEKPKREAGESMRTTTDAKRDLDYERQRKQERDRELSRYDRDHSFPEKKNYTPNVKLEYVDEKGRLLSTKEAFRFMSHKFHGRGSGKKKIEKRMKKITEQQLMNKSSSVDTPLNMLSVMQNKQKAAQTPYILLSGGSQSMLAPNLAKGK